MLNETLESLSLDNRRGTAPPPTSSSGSLTAHMQELLSGPGPDLALEPIMHLQTGTEVGVEALARFGGPLPTDAVFRLAHSEGIGLDVELRCLDRALEYVRATNATSSGFVGVNMSPAALTDPRSLALIERHECHRLVIELTDQTVAPELPLLRRRIDEVRDLGVRIALHVSGSVDTRAFSVIRPDMAKLRVSRWDDATRDDSELAQFLARSRAFVVAVGVDSKEALEQLQAYGVDAAQGHIFGPPRMVRG